MPAPLLLDLSHTSHTRARTGIQRVTRSLHAALGRGALAITHDPFLAAWRELETWEHANLGSDSAAAKRGARWPLAAQLRGRARRVLGRGAGSLPPTAGLIVPEVFSPGVAAAWPALFGQITGPRVAVFHDAIALRYPEFTAPKTLARFPAYLVELLAFDGVAAVSDDSRAALIEYWRWLGVRNTPAVQTISLGIEPRVPDAPGEKSPPAAPASADPEVLCVGSIEGRKNHLTLLDACEQLWTRGTKFSLHLIGLAQPQTAATALQKIRALQDAGRPLRYDGPATDAALENAYAHCAFTVYPSLVEGFGLPVIESVAHGKPCVCSSRGALGESARGGGCVMLEQMTAPALAEAIARLVNTPADLAQLARAARARRFRTWNDYSAELTEWLRTLRGGKKIFAYANA